MQTISFNTLRLRNNRSLEGQKNSSRIQNLLTKREMLAEAAKTLPQISRYNRENGTRPWDEKYTMLRELDSHEALEAWRALPNCKFKRFQQAFCDGPWHYVVPSFERDTVNNSIVYPPELRLSALSVKACLISPDHIPDDLIQQLGFVDLSIHKGSPVSRLFEKADLDNVIQRLKLLWDAAVPIASNLSRPAKGNNLRFLIIAEPTEALQNIYQGIKGPELDSLGALLSTRRHNRQVLEPEHALAKKYNPIDEHLTVSYFSNINTALRSTSHKQKSQKTEVRHLREMKETLRDLSHYIQTEWNSDTSNEHKQALSRDICMTIELLQESLESCSDLSLIHI